MANFKKIDDLEFVFVNKPLSEKDEKEFSDFLKNRKTKSIPKSKQNKNAKSATNPKKTELA
jgi:hypothetical protein